MAWEWSHSTETIDNIRNNLRKQNKEWLEECLEEIGALPKNPGPPIDVLAETVFEWTLQYRTCDNGGYNAWCCPHGCHTVPFDPIEDTDNE